MTRVNVEEIEAAKATLAAINQLKFTDIEWYRNGELIKIHPNNADFWLMTGLSNADFGMLKETDMVESIDAGFKNVDSHTV